MPRPSPEQLQEAKKKRQKEREAERLRQEEEYEARLRKLQKEQEEAERAQARLEQREHQARARQERADAERRRQEEARRAAAEAEARRKAETLARMEERRRREEEEKRKREEEEAARRRRIAEFGIRDWSAVCTEINAMLPEACASPSAYETGDCEARQRRAIKRRYVFRLDEVRGIVEYQERRKRFLVKIHGVISGDEPVDYGLGVGGVQLTLISPHAFRMSKGKAAGLALLRRLRRAIRPFLRVWKTFAVPVRSVQSPEKFEQDLRVEALVRVLATQEYYLEGVLDLVNVQVRVVGLQAYLVDGSWGKVLIRPPGGLLKKGCPDEHFAALQAVRRHASAAR